MVWGWFDNFSDMMSTLFTPVVTAATVAQAVFARNARLQLIEARRSADAADATLRLAQDTAERQLRAYMSVAAKKVTLKNGIPDSVEITFRNSGATPARNVRCLTAWCVGPVNADVRLALPSQAQGSVTDLGPGDDMGAVVSAFRWNEMGAHVLQDWKSGQLVLIVYGVVFYTDVFEHPRHTAFKMMNSPPMGERLMRCSEGNDAS